MSGRRNLRPAAAAAVGSCRNSPASHRRMKRSAPQRAGCQRMRPRPSGAVRWRRDGAMPGTAGDALGTRRFHAKILVRGATAVIPIRRKGRLRKEDCPAALALSGIPRATQRVSRVSGRDLPQPRHLPEQLSGSAPRRPGKGPTGPLPFLTAAPPRRSGLQPDRLTGGTRISFPGNPRSPSRRPRGRCRTSCSRRRASRSPDPSR